MADRYVTGHYYADPHAHSRVNYPSQMSYNRSSPGGSYGPPPPPSSYSGYSGYGQPASISPYMAGGYYGNPQYTETSAYRRYAPYASPHYSQHQHHQPPQHQHHHHHPHSHPGMFTAAGQQLIPSSVLHYPPRSNNHLYGMSGGYEPPAPVPYGSSAQAPPRGYHAAAYNPTPVHYTHGPHMTGAQSMPALSSHRSTTPAPNRTVLPSNYHSIESMRGCYPADPSLPSSLTHHHHHHRGYGREDATPPMSMMMSTATAHGELVAKQELEEAEVPPPPRLTTSPPMISATGTDSGISNCSTRARSDSSQSTPVYSSEYPVNMSVESASCVSYHCPADGRDYEDEREPPTRMDSMTESDEVNTPEVKGHQCAANDDITATTAPTSTSSSTSSSSSPPQQPQATVEKTAATTPTTTATTAASSDKTSTADASDGAEFNLSLPKDESQDVEHHDSGFDYGSGSGSRSTGDELWSPTNHRPPRTPPVPHNSPVGFGLTTPPTTSTTVPPALVPLLPTFTTNCSPRKSQGRRTIDSTRPGGGGGLSGIKNRNRVIECDLIPSKKSKRKSNKTSNEGNLESTVRQEIRDIKPLPGFLQAFGSTEIGRFSETFLQTPAENNSSSSNDNCHNFYPVTAYPDDMSPPYFDAHWANYDYRWRGSQGYSYADYMAYDRYATRGRYGEIRCDGY